ncbi:MAG: ATP-binding cassette domain-containing protein [Bradyrhizobium sp.]|uniref:branched-chain amino acid ABC transporter ATP-binding protein/permease n=1 Tax=Bradyrhizobium sp. TaxID=376 RepID=UPI0025C5D40A|nr:branched-chain amino acid ABC transporter ATP-binding protein/permease [Bradyrhizobium sp.]MBI5264004.1 ATP-binding cassette domain-containing protein [Bradyrhizobium sp.]
MSKRLPIPLFIAAFVLLVLPSVLLTLGLTMTSASEVVIYAMACMALNILVGHTGLVSFGHGAWFGLAAYAAALMQRNVMPDSIFGPTIAGVFIVAVIAAAFGFLILRRRGVYFSLLTLALSAMLYAVSFRWTEVTGGENGLGGITRPTLFGFNLESSTDYYWFVAAIALMVLILLWRFHNSAVGSVLVAIRENEERARFLGYPTNRYKLFAFTLSASITGLAGILLLYQNRMTSADPISVAFSGDLLAMVVIGGMRSFLGPALGALFFILFREFLGIYTENWLFGFGLIFVGFIVFSPTGLVGVGERLFAPFRRKVVEDAAMSARRVEVLPLPEFLRPKSSVDGPVLAAEHISKSFGGIRAVRDVDISVVDRTLHALIGPNGAGKTTAFNLLSGMFAPDHGSVSLMGQPIAGYAPEQIASAGIGRSFQITNLFPALSVAENIRLAVQARHPRRFDPLTPALSIEAINAETDATIRYLGLAGIETAEAGMLSYGGQRLLDMGVALATAPRILLLDEPLAGLAAAERERIGAIVKRISTDLPVLLVEHDIDRVFQLADRITVMNEGKVLLDGSVEGARASSAVQEIYIGSGTSAVAARPRETAARAGALLSAENVNTYYGKSHILNDVSFALHENEIIALLGRNGAGKSTLLKTLIGIAPAAGGSINLAGNELAGLPSAEHARLGIGYVPQGRGLFAGMSVAQNLELGALKRQTGNGVHWTRERIYEYFPRIKERLNSPADYLSGGEQQMVAVARALSGDVRVLLLDEPFEGLAPAVVEQLFETFDRLRREVAIIIVDHNLDLALALSDVTVALERGRVIHQGPSKALREDLELRRKVLWL